MNIVYKNVSDNCSGCGACYYTCPINSIELKTNTERVGEIAQIKEEACKNCNLCHKVCPEISSVQLLSPKKVYAAWVKDSLDYTTQSTFFSCASFTAAVRHSRPSPMKSPCVRILPPGAVVTVSAKSTGILP